MTDTGHTRQAAAGEIPERLEGARVVLRRLAADDLPALLAITQTPEVFRWWGPQDDLAELDAADEDTMFTVLVGDAVAGMIQFYENSDPEYRYAGMDMYLDPRFHGRGLGTDAVRTLARWLVTDRGHHRLVIDPDAENHAAIRCYAKAGFKPVGIMRRYWHDHATGVWRDGLLMDALADEILAGEPPDTT